MKPSIGRIVLYQRHGSPNGQHKAEASPAIVTRVVDEHREVVDLCVLNPTGIYFDPGTRHDQLDGSPGMPGAGGPWTPGTWRWPPRVG